MRDWKVGYITSYILTDDSYLGGLMITDSYGIPLEFKYTEPIRPTKIQKILYGQALEKYIKKEVIFLNLLSNVTEKPDLLITQEEVMLELVGSLNYPVVSLEETSLAPLVEVGVVQDINKKEFVLQVSPSGSPIRVTLMDANQESKIKVQTMILELEESMNLIEPLARVEGALKAICQENGE